MRAGQRRPELTRGGHKITEETKGPEETRGRDKRRQEETEGRNTRSHATRYHKLTNSLFESTVPAANSPRVHLLLVNLGTGPPSKQKNKLKSKKILLLFQKEEKVNILQKCGVLLDQEFSI